MISMLTSLLLLCFTALANDARVLDVPVGVSQVMAAPSKILKTPKYNFIFNHDDYSFRLVNKLITKEVIIAFLPPEYALKAIWTSEALDIVGKGSKHYLYLVSNDKNKNFVKENLKNKKILMLENSADEFYLKKYLGGVLYKKYKGTAFELLNAFENKEKPDYVLMDSMSYYLLKKKKAGLAAFRIDGGVYYVLTLMRENETMFNPLSREIFIKNNIPYYDLNKRDLVELKNLNNSMIKKHLAQKNFEFLHSELMQR
jgi:hypothetical protein